MEGIDFPTVEEYEAGFRQIARRLTPNQRRMLEYHAGKDGPVTARELASVVGFKNHSGANMQYGGIGTLLRDVSSKMARMPGQKSFAFAGFEKEPGGEWEWHMRAQVREALQQLGWVQSK